VVRKVKCAFAERLQLKAPGRWRVLEECGENKKKNVWIS